jgi:hypothetical protein
MFMPHMPPPQASAPHIPLPQPAIGSDTLFALPALAANVEY